MKNKPKLLKLLIFLLLSFTSIDAVATGQYPDKIVIDGTEYIIRNNPLEPYFEKYPDKKPTTGILSSALHRGYIATFTLINKRLYLINIEIKKEKKSDKGFETEMVSVFDKVFPNEDKILMDLYSGILVVHLNLDKSYKSRKKLLIEFLNGIDQEERTYDYEKYNEFINAQFELYKQTEKYKQNFIELKKRDDEDEEYEDSFIESLIREYTPNFTSKFTD